VVDADVASRIRLDRSQCEEHLDILRSDPGFREKVLFAYRDDFSPGVQDVDAAIYAGFIPDSDRAILDHLLSAPPHELHARNQEFADARLPELVYRFRARNHPSLLTKVEMDRWKEHCRQALTSEDSGDDSPLESYRKSLREVKATQNLSAAQASALQDTEDYVAELLKWLGGPVESSLGADAAPA